MECLRTTCSMLNCRKSTARSKIFGCPSTGDTFRRRQSDSVHSFPLFRPPTYCVNLYPATTPHILKCSLLSMISQHSAKLCVCSTSPGSLLIRRKQELEIQNRVKDRASSVRVQGQPFHLAAPALGSYYPRLDGPVDITLWTGFICI